MVPIVAVQEITDKRSVRHDGPVTIAVGRNRKDIHWRNQTILWSQFLGRLSACRITGDSLAEYRAMPKSEQDKVKDVGGFVGGELRGGLRKAANVVHRQLVTLDADHVTFDLWAIIEKLFDFACAVYSTHSHEPQMPRLRLVIPLSRPVSVEEYQAVSRRLAADLGIDQFDGTTFEPHRLMYWPSCPRDVEPVFLYQDMPWQDPDAVLQRYTDWRDPSSWPEPERSKRERTRLASRQQDPREKGGIVGAFCRAYSIPQAIETFLSDVYEPFDHGRYTYIPGSTTGGLVIYDDGAFAYSHHGTDPAGGRLVNAFDLVRLHKYGELDAEAQPATPTVRLPSYTAMSELASQDEKVRLRLGQERLQQAAREFGQPDGAGNQRPASEDHDDNTWMANLELSATGVIKSTRHNVLLVLENDPHLKGKIALNEFTGRPAVRGDLPWRPASLSIHWQDRDDEALRVYLEHVYVISGAGKVSDALGTLLHRQRFHPVRDYLRSLQWDGVQRLDTLLVDLLGAADTPYVRAVTRKALVAAVARVMRPGCKFDYVLVLVGPQGIGKSLLLKKLGREWFSDSLTTVIGKEAYEQLQGAWILELGELAATRRAEAEAIKHFITKQEDIYRVAYGRQTSVFPRQCVFFGTTNAKHFLKDATGNRRFWPVQCGVKAPTERLLRLSDDEVGLIWAEAVKAFDDGEELYLSDDVARQALAVQEAHREESERAGAIREYLETPLPLDWHDRDIAARRQYIHGGEFGAADVGETKLRDRVCVMEIWVELFMGDPKNLTRLIANEIHDVLRTTEGWAPHQSGTGKLYFGKAYGHQKAYVRTNVPS